LPCAMSNHYHAVIYDRGSSGFQVGGRIEI
jgi:hypothetical protein